ncbi:rod shape-determining protein MreC [uncultured Clostridium sp.]|uniref:Cell shape-determining protein MreC n=1 Tax=Muricoprocola aceti TaxID=2981772 RepID=A0ABT2SHF0_9FIRM|nr:rod shape-determining protein MreC [Muricoprocola aceti]MCI7226807.1 rod shape-determining protein MreC [Lachnospiraceae bacterium]MCQ4772328.1 rod shape-determining protein MreC [Lacrimispora saccharolytica]SCG93938.1 rod shape-determining protein MreC [uncultured Clostridium sp.]MCU6723924.1 rod shape-determining protein MreC [Muricoprocola aceti]MDD7435487.1 rod shape-determining protein MreC [Lachnospiraceae bacterium]
MKKNTMEEHTKSKLILFFLSLFCGIMIIVSFALEFTDSPVKDVVGVVLTPIQSGINHVGGWFSGKMDYFEDNLKLAAQNEELQSQVDQLTVENTQLLQDKDELNSLRDLYELDHKYETYEKVGARVISKDDSSNWFSTFTIDKGSNDGLAVDMNVMAGSGLVGIITDVGPNWATVRSIIDDYSNVSAQISETEDTCIIAGDLSLTDEGTVRLVKLNDPDSKVKVGDTVVTSQISDIFLPGILIGYVSEIGVDSNNLTHSGLVSTVVDFKDIKEVLVIKNLKQKAES